MIRAAFHTIKQIKAAEWERKWFLLLILFKPLIDGTFWLKEYSVFLSPLYIVGVGVPAAVLIGAIFRHRPLRIESPALLLYSVLCTATSILLIIMHQLSVGVIEAALKISLVSYMYYYARRTITKPDHFVLFLKVSLIAAVVTFALLLYETSTGPLKYSISRGVIRFEGIYADVVSYSLYMVTGLIAGLSLVMIKKKENAYAQRISLFVAIGIAILYLVSINHVASYAVTAAIVVAYLYYSKMRHELFVGIAILIIAVSMYGFGDYFEKIVEESEIMSREYEVVTGERDISQGFHGRFTRWNVIEQTYEGANALSYLFGIPYDNELKNYYHWTLVGPHNDFIRIFVSTGVIGLISFIAFIVGTIRASWKSERGLSYCAVAVCIAWFLYSVSAVPTIYSTFVFFAVPVMSYVRNYSGRENNV